MKFGQQAVRQAHPTPSRQRLEVTTDVDAACLANLQEELTEYVDTLKRVN